LLIAPPLATLGAAHGEEISMRRLILAALLSASASAAIAAPTPKDQLLVPPPNAEHFVVVSEAGKHGDQWRWTLPDGSRAYRYSQSLRGWITETDETIRADASGVPVDVKVRGVSPNGDQAETYSVANGQGRWVATVDEGTAPAGRFYLANGGINIADEFMIDRLVAAGDKGIDLLPSGHATLTPAGHMSVDGPNGKRNLELAFIKGIGGSPFPVWLDENRKLFGYVSFISVLPAGYENVVVPLRDYQDAATAEAVKNIAHQFLAPANSAPVLFDHVKLFDADKGVFLADRAVLAESGKIAAIGAGGSLKLPAGGRLIDGRGKTLVPGLWDAHRHIGDDWAVLSNMAEGITNFRSPGNGIERAQSVIKRRASGDLLAPEGWYSVIVDQAGPLAAQGSLTVKSEADTIAAVDKIKAAGLTGVKFYTSMNPAWIAPGAAEAHKLGLHVHGHIPAHMRPLDAVRDGYDEVTHINFVMMQAMPQDVVDKANTAARIEGPARYAQNVDLTKPPITTLIAEFKRRGTYVDPTLVAFEDQFMKAKGGEPGPAYAPYADIVPAAVARSFKSEGYPLVNGLTRADFQKSYAKLIALTGALHKAGIPIVAGTDGEGMELVRELELYKQAGFTPAAAIQSATIVPARLVGADKRTGSIAVGKEADMILVDGDPSKELGALRRVLTVVSDGVVMDGDALRTAAGYSGRPK
jgi:predicted amidohydrolase YtcJ